MAERREITLPDGRLAWEYDNGLIKDQSTGYIVKPISDKPFSDPVQASAAANFRWDQARAAIVAGLASASPFGLPVNTLELIVAARAKEAQSEGRNAIESSRLLFQLIGWLSTGGRLADILPGDDGATVILGGALAKDVLAAISAIKQARSGDPDGGPGDSGVIDV
jgi:hypothetical protein